MTDSPPPEQSARARILEDASGIGLCLALLLLLLIHAAVPLAVALWWNPWMGVLAAIVSVATWRAIGPPPCPGYLNGIVCLAGYAAITGQGFVCLMVGIRDLIRG